MSAVIVAIQNTVTKFHAKMCEDFKILAGEDFKIKSSDTEPVLVFNKTVSLFLENMQQEYKIQKQDYSDSDSVEGNLYRIIKESADCAVNALGCKLISFVTGISWIIANFHIVKATKTISIDNLFLVMTLQDPSLSAVLRKIKNIKAPKAEKPKKVKAVEEQQEQEEEVKVTKAPKKKTPKKTPKAPEVIEVIEVAKVEEATEVTEDDDEGLADF
jgi:hypothetical protein